MQIDANKHIINLLKKEVDRINKKIESIEQKKNSAITDRAEWFSIQKKIMAEANPVVLDKLIKEAKKVEYSMTDSIYCKKDQDEIISLQFLVGRINLLICEIQTRSE